ncbi:phosphoribosylaminoimidazolesuccinocarboxamide synthase [Thermotomaculum hydrothermale]|nr:phosphoribosylaminoimidazolesuccinocarboxamide synthase [Thermotomaculum hydrothermale]
MIIEELNLVKQGKVRDIYSIGDNLLFVATDRISAFDVVLGSEIPDKGRVLNLISAFWFDKTSHIVKNHMIEWNFNNFPEELKKYGYLKNRSMIVKKAKPLPVECIVRGYLVGSGYKEYKNQGTVCGIKLPEGLNLASKLDEPIFTPSTKAESGHDENISFEKMKEIIGEEKANKVRDISLALYKFAYEYAYERGIIIADTKFEFGEIGGEIILIDEALTPDSSRFWPVEGYREGENPPSFDKQYGRDYLESIKWNKKPPAPELPKEVIENTRKKYFEAFHKLTGKKMEEYL